jgi:hypothetical protein
MGAVLVLVIQVVLGLPRKTKDLIAYCRNIITMMTGNAHYPSPTPTLAQLEALVDALDKAEQAMVGKGAGLASARDAQKKLVKQGFGHLRDYIQGIIESTLVDVVSVIESSGMRVKKRTTRSKLLMAITDGLLSGSVEIVVKAVPKAACYYWQFSLDGKAWTSAPETTKVTTTITGLTAGQTYSFRFRSLTRTGATDWSQAMTHLVK